MGTRVISNRMYIAGAWTAAADGARIEVVNPANEECVDTVPVATPADVDAALNAAAGASAPWQEVDVWTRSALVRRVAELIRDRCDPIAEALTEEQGKPLAESKAEIRATAEQFAWYADEARRAFSRAADTQCRPHAVLMFLQPIGAVAAFSPWHSPALALARIMAPAVAAGCPIIATSPAEAPRTALCLAEACHDGGIPEGVVNVVTGDTNLIAERVAQSDVVRKVIFCGPVWMGRKILRLCADSVKPVSMELGGCSPVLVFEDADVERTAETAARGKFCGNGRPSAAAGRFYVQKSVAERFVNRFVEVVRSLRLGDGRDPGTEVGPLAGRRRLEIAEALVADAVSKGAEVRCGGERPDEFKRGFYYRPTVLTNVSPDMRVMYEEAFSPVAPIATFTDLADALAKANSTESGLAGYIYTSDTKTALAASEGLEADVVAVNSLFAGKVEAAFMDARKPGFSWESGKEGIESYTVAKYVSIRL